MSWSSWVGRFWTLRRFDFGIDHNPDAWYDQSSQVHCLCGIRAAMGWGWGEGREG